MLVAIQSELLYLMPSWVVIPKPLREKHGLKKGSLVQVMEYGPILVIVPLPEDPVEAQHGMFEGGYPGDGRSRVQGP